VPFETHDRFRRRGFIVCDGCDSVLTSDGAIASKKRRELDPEELALHEHGAVEGRHIARSTGWTSTGDALRVECWMCPACSLPPDSQGGC
jgi:hypothetical protein